MGKRGKRRQWIPTARKTGKSRKHGNMCDLIMVKG